MTSVCQCISLAGLRAFPVSVEVDVARGQPTFTLVGLGDLAVQEARERVWSSLRNSPFSFPLTRKTVNLAPAATRKTGTHFDLAIAVGLLVASGQCSPVPGDVVLLGELGLDGQLRAPRGLLPLVRGAFDIGARSVIIPSSGADDVALVHNGAAISLARNLVEVVASLRREIVLPRAPQPRVFPPCAPDVDVASIQGQALAKRALEIAAAGAHHVLLVGPPGSGKTLLARSVQGILPPLDAKSSLEAAELHSLVGTSFHGIYHAPFRTPHHTCTPTALIGGGPLLAPGELPLGHRGVVFLDELPLFRRDALEALREPLEEGLVRIRRAHGEVTYPASVLVIAAMNPCPCGPTPRGCSCDPRQAAMYRSRISGPLLDRIDIVVTVERLPAAQLVEGHNAGSTSRDVRARVVRAARRAEDRQGCVNARVPGHDLTRHAALAPDAEQLLIHASEQLALTARGIHRTLRVARTIADLADRSAVSVTDVAEALQYRGWNRH